MKHFHLTRKKKLRPQDVGRPQPQAAPQPETRAPTNRPVSPAPEPRQSAGRRKRMAQAVPEEDALWLSRTIREGSQASVTSDASTLPTPRVPLNASVVSFASSMSVRERRSSSRSLELLRAAAEDGHLDDLLNLFPMPDPSNLQVVRKFAQWGEEAGSEAEKQQRTRLVRAFAQVAQNNLEELTIDDADLVLDLPVALTELTTLRAITLKGLRRVTHVPDLRLLTHLQSIEVEACPELRLPESLHARVVMDGVRQPLPEDMHHAEPKPRLFKSTRDMRSLKALHAVPPTAARSAVDLTETAQDRASKSGYKRVFDRLMRR